ncbi:MAG: Beta-lactamase class C-like and penicillin binding proteins (PBPs) superfamily, partial [uncultured Gemmatimonadetes bacterium]
ETSPLHLRRPDPIRAGGGVQGRGRAARGAGGAARHRGARAHAQPHARPRLRRRARGADGEEPRGARVVPRRGAGRGQPDADPAGGGVRKDDVGRGRTRRERGLHPLRPRVAHQGGRHDGGGDGAGGGRPAHAGRPRAPLGAAVLGGGQGQHHRAHAPDAHGRAARGGQRHRQRGAGRRAPLPHHPPAGDGAGRGRAVLGHRLRHPVDRGPARRGRAPAGLPQAPRVGAAGDGIHPDGRAHPLRPLRAHAAPGGHGGPLHGRIVRRGGAAAGRRGGERGHVQHGARPGALRRDDRQRGAAGERAHLPEAHRPRVRPAAGRGGDAGAGLGSLLPRRCGARPRGVQGRLRLRPHRRHRHLALDRAERAELGGAPQQPHLHPQAVRSGHAAVPAPRVPCDPPRRI